MSGQTLVLNKINESENEILSSRNMSMIIKSDNLLYNKKTTCSTCSLLHSYPDNQIHYYVVCHPSWRYIIVSIDPSIPRYDKDYSRSCFHCLMLIFFVLWWFICDLINLFEDWADAFQCQLTTSCLSKKNQLIIDNMQILHKYKDSHDNHWTNKHLWISQHLSFEISNETIVDDKLYHNDIDNDEKLFLHLDRLENCQSHQINVASKEISFCLSNAQQGGLFAMFHLFAMLPEKPSLKKQPDEELMTGPSSTQAQWHLKFDYRKEQWRKSAQASTMKENHMIMNDIEVTLQIPVKFVSLTINTLSYIDNSISSKHKMSNIDLTVIILR